MGLRIPAERIDGTSSSSSSSSSAAAALSDALVSVGAAGRGGTGSFVSESGLVLTNWHVAYDAVRQASLRSNGTKDYVKDGFVARSFQEELVGPNYELWITKSCVDVSDQVLEVIQSEPDDPLQRANKVRDVVQEIAQTAQSKLGRKQDGEGFRCDVQEMLPNESYVLFTYERLRDVRIVYVPPKSLGNFGGDVDNFEWPRHTADFTLLRAYVDQDGNAADYSPDNVPYRSNANRIRVQPKGANEGDTVFLLGFPGRTMRYAPSPRLEYSDTIAVPHMVQDFTRKLELIAQHETHSELAALKVGGSKKSLANELKRSQGKLVMMRKLGLIPERQQEEERLVAQSPPEAKQALDRLRGIYHEFTTSHAVSSALEACRGIYAGSALLAAGHGLHEYLVVERRKPDHEREATYRERNLPFLCRRLSKRLGDIHIPHEAALVQDAIDKLLATNALEALHPRIQEIFGDCTIATIEAMVSASTLGELDGEGLQALVLQTSKDNDVVTDNDETTILKDPFVQCASVLYESYKTERDVSKALISERDALFATLLEYQRKLSEEEVFYPDCNGSLRISAGFVEGYKAADAVVHTPSTTLAGLLDKAVEARLGQTTNVDEATAEDLLFGCPERLYQRLLSDEQARNVPVCVLYSTDTVGGNSGSPVMNADGELVAINFDRQRQGLMNEFKWSRDYSRSIGVDIRYMLWLIGDYDGAANLVEEMLA